MEQVKQPKKKISHALMAGILIILIFLGVSLGILGSSTYLGGMMSRYEAHIESLLRLVETRIDADDLKACIENGKHSEKYDELQVLLDEIKETCDIKFIYIVKTEFNYTFRRKCDFKEMLQLFTTFRGL